jgi:proprotein convertase subtilisin/kexin type 5
MGTCVLTCPETLYGNSELGTCENCHSVCATCNGAYDSDCTGCFDLTYLYDNKCIKSCPEGYYAMDEPFNECMACHASCASCTGG